MPGFFFEKKVYENTWANRPSAVGNNGMMLYISDVGVGGSYWFSNGTTWRAMTGKYLLDSINAPIVTGSGTTATVIKTVTIPANLIKDGDKIMAECSFIKTGTVDTFTTYFAIGPNGGTSDPYSLIINQPQGTNLLNRFSYATNFYSPSTFVSTTRNTSGWGTTTVNLYTGAFDKTILNYLSIAGKFTTGVIETATLQEFDIFHITGGV